MHRQVVDKLRNWRQLGFFLVLMIGIGLGAFFAILHTTGEEPVTDPVELARLDAQAEEQARRQEMADHMREIQQRAREAQDRFREAAQLAREHAEQAMAAGAPLLAGAEKPLDLSPFEYPGASTGNYSRIPGNEMVQLRSSDSFERIVQHYQKQLGKPLLLFTDEDDKRAFFQSTASPGVLVSIAKDEDHGSLWSIAITRAPFQFPPLEVPMPAQEK